MPLIKPMLAKTGNLPDNQTQYSFEIKWDGIRTILYFEDSKCKIVSRNLKDLTGQYPELTALASSIGTGHQEIILDGEIVAFNTAGLPSFSLLQHRMGVTDDKLIAKLRQEIPVHYIIFDILSLDGNLLLDKNYLERRSILASLALEGPNWQTPGFKTGDGQAILTASRNLGLEGIVAKRLDSSYQAGKRTGAWLKIKNQRRQELIIGGWVPGQGTRQGKIGALLVGCYDITQQNAKTQGISQRLLYAGKVGTGFTQATLQALAKQLAPLYRDDNPFDQDLPVKNVRYVEPVLIGEFEFTEWTPNHTLRHPSFKGLRYDKNPRQVIREE
ncbi:non-homologous end-joining DNA ligase [Sporomusa aerivorans]|uniref:non-homologous end-joining DNA ligase n=1 Tax=Sporomusa aerivorans TaxID=204936 RepID=UPI003529FC31